MSNKINDTSAHDDLAAYQPEKYCHNIEHQGAEGITNGGEDKLVIRKGGADDQTDTGMSGGRSLL